MSSPPDTYKIEVMNNATQRISRRSFLKLLGTSLSAAAIRFPDIGEYQHNSSWPSLTMEELPRSIQAIIEKVPRTKISAAGFLTLLNQDGEAVRQIPQAYTRWNKERRAKVDRLRTKLPWGIVLHWYGDKETFDPTITGYLRGFDSLRPVSDYITRTSAHFLVGNQALTPVDGKEPLSILQTQAPDYDGWPFLASHLQALDYQAHRERKQYFVRAYYQLAEQESSIHSILQDLFDGPRADPNLYTIAIEICGYDFDHPEHQPGQQQIANVVSVVMAVMRRYHITANNLLGHHEIQLGKADPGKKFLALIRYLIAVKALVDRDPVMNRLVFGQFLDQEKKPGQAVSRYFRFVRDYLVLVGTQRDVFDWEGMSGYWLTHSLMNQTNIIVAHKYRPPLPKTLSGQTQNYLDPENHEGIDLLGWEPKNTGQRRPNQAYVQLVADGICLHIGESDRCHQGKTAIFTHIREDGAQFLSIYANMTGVGELSLQKHYPVSYPVGTIISDPTHSNPSLHMAIAYGATWDTDLSLRPTIPYNAGTTWIQARYMNPIDYLYP
jgi:hypothetical protein